MGARPKSRDERCWRSAGWCGGPRCPPTGGRCIGSAAGRRTNFYGAAFSCYTSSPTRVRYSYARGVLVEMFREAEPRLGGDPVAAWADIQADPVSRRRYQRARGKGGLVPVSWDEAREIVAAAHVHTIAQHGPDRVAGVPPVPALSIVSHVTGARLLSLIGGSMLKFFDRCADLPVASPQTLGDQTDVPESASLTIQHLDTARGSSSGGSAQTVDGWHTHTLRRTLIALRAGQALDEHETWGEATIHVLHGSVRLTTTTPPATELPVTYSSCPSPDTRPKPSKTPRCC